MLTAGDIRDVRFSKAVGGYKQDEVDNLLDTVEEDYNLYEAKIAELDAQIAKLENEVETYKNSQSSLQNILIEAQKLADKTVNDAKEKAELIISEAKAAADKAAGEAKIALDTFDVRFSEKKTAAQAELDAALEVSKKKQEAVEAATAEAVKRQQALFDKTRIEIAQFKNELLELYKKQLALVSEMPDCVAMDAVRAAEAVSLDPMEEPKIEAVQAAESEEEDVKIHTPEAEEPKGFTFNENALPFEEESNEEENEDEEDVGFFKNGFFRK